jgi:hypothetical protein
MCYCTPFSKNAVSVKFFANTSGLDAGQQISEKKHRQDINDYVLGSRLSTSCHLDWNRRVMPRLVRRIGMD